MMEESLLNPKTEASGMLNLDRLNGNSPTLMSASGRDVFAEEFSPSVSSTPATSSAK
jgi:hypothetical protein